MNDAPGAPLFETIPPEPMPTSMVRLLTVAPRATATLDLADWYDRRAAEMPPGMSALLARARSAELTDPEPRP